MCKFFERLESEGSRCEDGIHTGQVVSLPQPPLLIIFRLISQKSQIQQTIKCYQTCNLKIR